MVVQADDPFAERDQYLKECLQYVVAERDAGPNGPPVEYGIMCFNLYDRPIDPATPSDRTMAPTSSG